jgi:hypothetical protein
MLTTFAQGFKHSSPMKLTVFEVSGADVGSSGNGEKIFMKIRSPVGRRPT